MTTGGDVCFEMPFSGNIVRLDPVELIKYDSNLDWDKNWVKTIVTLRGGEFYGKYTAEFMTIDFEKFKQELSQLYDNLTGTANFYDLDDYLELKIVGDGIGHFKVNVIACDQPGIYASRLTFTMSFDQTQLKELVNQLERVTKQFPIVGDLKIRNK